MLYFALRSRLSIRTIYVSGMSLVFPVLASVGVLEWLKRDAIVSHRAASWSQAGLLFIWAFIYGMLKEEQECVV